jgi:putative membrane protein
MLEGKLEELMLYIHGLPSFMSYFAIGGILMVLYVYLYNRLTTFDEWELIKQNDSAAAVAFSGSLVGFVIPLASAIQNAQTNLGCLFWGFVALLVQLIAFFAVRMIVPAITERIRRGEVAAGILLAAISLNVGLLNAASMFY